MIYKVTKHLTHPSDPAWELLTSFTLQSNAHPQRVQSFRLAREALRLALLEYEKEVHLADLVLLDYHRLEKFPEYRISLTHNKTYGAAVIAPSFECLSVGIDIEDINRQTRPDVMEKIRHPQDAELAPLERWCLKEAAYKALVNSKRVMGAQKFSEIFVSKQQWTHAPSGVNGMCEMHFLEGQILAIAWIQGQNSSWQGHGP